MLLQYALESGSLQAASESVNLGPTDAETHVVNGALLRSTRNLAAALPHFERAVALRPRDYYLWLELGLARDENNDPAGAVSAFNEAVRLAPYYAQPLWQRGNVHLRAGRYDEAFADLRAAAQSDPNLVPNLIDLSWNISGQNVALAEQLAQATTPELHHAFARYLIQRGRPIDALRQYRAAGPLGQEHKRELIAELIARNAVAEAYEIWAGPEAAAGSEALIYDASFEGPLNLDESGFGWRVSRNLKGANLSLETSQPHAGSRSLMIEFAGESSPDLPLISQVMVVRPSTTYKLSFNSRTKDLITGGLPFVRVAEIGGEGKTLGQSANLSDSDSWRETSFAFTTDSRTTAVSLTVQRQNCTTSPCPAFGSLWLDSFTLNRAMRDPGDDGVSTVTR